MGFLVPPWFHQGTSHAHLPKKIASYNYRTSYADADDYSSRTAESPSDYTVEVVAILLGFSLGSAVFAAAKAIRQTYLTWRRLGRKLTAYIIMVWVCWSCGIALSSLNFAYLKSSIPPNFWALFVEIIVWGVQIQCLLQILANRISLVMFSPVWARRLRIAVFFIITLVVIIVGIFWIPAQLQISHTFDVANAITCRAEKVFFFIVHAALNFLFIYLVRSKLIQQGLTKYQSLFHFNLAMVAISISLDIAVIGIIWLPDIAISVQFRALTYIVKLYIEMTIADLIAKVVRSTTRDGSLTDDWAYDLETSGGQSGRTPTDPIEDELSGVGRARADSLSGALSE